jgi:hypothetical protein
MRRHLTFALALAAVGACTFPNATYSDGGAGDDDSGPYDSGGTDRTSSSSGGSSGGSSGSSGGVDAMGDRGSTDSASDVTTSDSSSSSSGSGSSSGGSMCDKDSDGYLATGACGGNDCCDTDGNAHPNQASFYAQLDACGSYDYNCNGKEDEEWGVFSCSVSLGTCTPTPGFISGPPGCGVTQPWTGTCQYLVTSCSAGSTSPQAQACN